MLPKASSLVGLRKRSLLSAAVLGGHGIVIIGAGHGVGPIALLELFGRAEEYLLAQTFGWLGVALLLLSVIHGLAFRYLAPLAIVALAISTALFVQLSEVWPISAATSLPFVGASLFLGRALLSPRARSTNAVNRAGAG